MLETPSKTLKDFQLFKSGQLQSTSNMISNLTYVYCSGEEGSCADIAGQGKTFFFFYQIKEN